MECFEEDKTYTEKEVNEKKDLNIKMKNKKVIVVSYILYLIMLTWIIVFKFRLDLSSLKYIRSVNLIPFKSNGVVNGVSEILINLMLL